MNALCKSERFATIGARLDVRFKIAFQACVKLFVEESVDEIFEFLAKIVTIPAFHFLPKVLTVLGAFYARDEDNL